MGREHYFRSGSPAARHDAAQGTVNLREQSIGWWRLGEILRPFTCAWPQICTPRALPIRCNVAATLIRAVLQRYWCDLDCSRPRRYDGAAPFASNRAPSGRWSGALKCFGSSATQHVTPSSHGGGLYTGPQLTAVRNGYCYAAASPHFRIHGDAAAIFPAPCGRHMMPFRASPVRHALVSHSCIGALLSRVFFHRNFSRIRGAAGYRAAYWRSQSLKHTPNIGLSLAGG